MNELVLFSVKGEISNLCPNTSVEMMRAFGLDFFVGSTIFLHWTSLKN